MSACGSGDPLGGPVGHVALAGVGRDSARTPTEPRRSRALATRYSQVIGLRFCGIVDEPTCPSVDGSATSAISVDWSRTISAAIRSAAAAISESA